MKKLLLLIVIILLAYGFGVIQDVINIHNHQEETYREHLQMKAKTEDFFKEQDARMAKRQAQGAQIHAEIAKQRAETEAAFK